MQVQVRISSHHLFFFLRDLLSLLIYLAVTHLFHYNASLTVLLTGDTWLNHYMFTWRLATAAAPGVDSQQAFISGQLSAAMMLNRSQLLVLPEETDLEIIPNPSLYRWGNWGVFLMVYESRTNFVSEFPHSWNKAKNFSVPLENLNPFSCHDKEKPFQRYTEALKLNSYPNPF